VPPRLVPSQRTWGGWILALLLDLTTGTRLDHAKKSPAKKKQDSDRGKQQGPRCSPRSEFLAGGRPANGYLDWDRTNLDDQMMPVRQRSCDRVMNWRGF